MKLDTETPRLVTFETWMAIADEFVALSQELLTRQPYATFWDKPDGSPVGDADLLIEKAGFACFRKHVPSIPVLSEESDVNANMYATSRFISFDPIDYTRGYQAGEIIWGTCAGLIEYDVPTAGLFMQAGCGRYLLGMKGHGVWWRPPGNEKWERFVRSKVQPIVNLSRSNDPRTIEKTRRAFAKFKTRYGHETNLPSGHAGANVVTGDCSAWLTMARTQNHDAAGNAAMILESGGVIHHIDGKPVRWSSRSLGAEDNPIIFAPSLEKAIEISEAFDD